MAAKIEIEAPSDWQIVSSEERLASNVFLVEDVEKAIFFVGDNFRRRTPIWRF